VAVVTFTTEQIAAREKVWKAHRDKTDVHLTAEEASALWMSILATSLKLSDQAKV
jgi:hypothetical protein